MKKKFINFNPFFYKLININEKIEFIISNFDNFIFSNSFSFEDIFIFYIFYKKNINLNNIFLNTNLIDIKFIKFIEKFKNYYNINKNIINYAFPDKNLIKKYLDKYSINGYYNNIILRKLCCQIRKVEKLENLIKNNNIWITGLTRYQSFNRNNIYEFEYIKNKKITKLNILYNWRLSDIFYFLEKFNILLLEKFNLGYLSSGCEPCTKPIFINKSFRSGRWWWENSTNHECGIHE